MARRKMLEDTPIPSTNEDAVVFDTSEIPWWAWVRRFHLPEVRVVLSPTSGLAWGKSSLHGGMPACMGGRQLAWRVCQLA